MTSGLRIATPVTSITGGSTKKLLPFQKEAIKQIYDRIREGYKRIIFIGGCGCGKTFLSSSIIRDATKKNLRCLFLVDRTKLLGQAHKELTGLGLRCSILQGKAHIDPYTPVIIVSLQSLDSRLRRGESLGELFGNVGLIVADECHETAFRASYEELERVYSAGNTFFLGLTATPWRLSKKQWLGQKYDTQVEAPQPPELVRLKRIVPARTFRVGKIFDFSQLDIRGGDYLEAQLESMAIRPEALEFVVEQWKKLGENRPTAAFCVNKNHARLLTEAFLEAGIPAELQTGETSQEEREQQDLRLSTGRTKVLVSVGTLTTGWDCTAVSCILYVYATLSKARYHQGSGRGARTHPGKEYYLLLDFGNNGRHGDPCGLQDYYIGEPKTKDRGETLMDKTCPQCNLSVSIFLKVCPDCNHEFVSDNEEEEKLDLNGMEMIEVFTPLDKQRLKFLRDRKRACYKAGINPQGAVDAFRGEFGFVPPGDWHKGAVFGGGRKVKNARKLYEEYLWQFAPHAFWVKIQMKLEFDGFGDSPSPTPMDKPDPWWVVLNVHPGADREAVRKSYLNAMGRFHPDRGGDLVKAQEINNAWEEYRRLHR